MPDSSGGGEFALPVPDAVTEPPRPGLDYFPARILLREQPEAPPPRRPRPPQRLGPGRPARADGV